MSQAVAQQLGAMLDATFDVLEDLADSIRRLLSDGHRTRADLVALDTDIDALLARHPELLGLGFVARPGWLRDADRLLRWRQRDAAGAPAPHELQLDLTGDDPYDYPEMEWFRVPATEDRRMVSGPYFDYRGNERYTLTFGVPVQVEGEFAGIAGADQLISELERSVLPVLRRIPSRAALLNHERRVVTANAPSLVTGERLAVEEMDKALERWPVTEDQGWCLVVLPPLR